MSIDCDYCDTTCDTGEDYLNHLFHDHKQEEVSEADERRVTKYFSEKKQNTDNTDTLEEETTTETDASTEELETTTETDASTEELETTTETSSTITSRIRDGSTAKYVGAIGLLLAIVVVGLVASGSVPTGSPFGDATDTNQTAPSQVQNLSQVKFQPIDVGSNTGEGTIVMVVDGKRVDFSQAKYQQQDDAFYFENGNGDTWHKSGRRVSLEYALHTVGIEVNQTALYYEGTVYRETEQGVSIKYIVNGVSVNPKSVLINDGDYIRVSVETSG